MSGGLKNMARQRAGRALRSAGRGFEATAIRAAEVVETVIARAGPALGRGVRGTSALLDRDLTTKAEASEPGGAVAFPLPPLEAARAEIAPIADAIGTVLAGQDRLIRQALACYVAGGHLLLEGPPGLGKTTLAHGLAAVTGREFRRIQFTADLMPGDITGVPVFDPETRAFNFHPGPVFTRILLADEINRAAPRAQSALLEAMEEGQVSVDGESHALAQGFFVIATQNPLGQIGAFPLPESQLDRFLMRLTFTHPTRAHEMEVLRHGDSRADAAGMAALGAEMPRGSEPLFQGVTITGRMLGYIQDLIENSRDPGRFAMGLSVRAGLGLVRAARAWAWMHGRDWVEPEDVQSVFSAVAGHRIVPRAISGDPAEAVLHATPLP